eukprot:Stramenopile-MAST_4_protein_2687
MSSPPPSTSEVPSTVRPHEQEEADTSASSGVRVEDLEEIESSVLRLREQRFRVEKMKLENQAKDEQIRRLEAQVATLGTQKTPITSPGETTSTPPSVLTAPSPDFSHSPLNIRYENLGSLATLQADVDALKEEKLVLLEQLKLARRTEEKQEEEYFLALNSHKELETRLRREIDLCEEEKHAERRALEGRLRKLEEECRKSSAKAAQIERERAQISNDLSAALVSMEEAQNAQLRVTASFENEVKQLKAQKLRMKKRLTEISTESTEHATTVVHTQQKLDAVVRENEEYRVLNEELKHKVQEASSTVAASNSEMEAQRYAMTEATRALDAEREKRHEAERLLRAAEDEVRTLRSDLEGSNRTLSELRVLGSVLQSRTEENQDREENQRREYLDRIAHLEKALESERQNRREWAHARVQLLQEFCREDRLTGSRVPTATEQSPLGTPQREESFSAEKAGLRPYGFSPDPDQGFF